MKYTYQSLTSWRKGHDLDHIVRLFLSDSSSFKEFGCNICAEGTDTHLSQMGMASSGWMIHVEIAKVPLTKQQRADRDRACNILHELGYVESAYDLRELRLLSIKITEINTLKVLVDDESVEATPSVIGELISEAIYVCEDDS